MQWRRPHVLALTLVAAAAAFLYFRNLGSSTPYLSIEEVSQARAALTLASQPEEATQREAADSVRPPIQAVPDPNWTYLAPLWVFLAAVLLKFVGFSEMVLRAPSASAGVANVLLMFALAHEIFGRTRPAVFAATLLMLAPVHFTQSRIATGQIGTITFVLAWLVFLVRYVRDRQRRDLFLATLLLGIGTYAYAGGLIMMPVYFLLSLAVAARCRANGTTKETLSIACAGFGLAVLPLAIFHLLHVSHLRSVATYYTHGEYNNNLGWRGFFQADVIRHLDAWWDCYNLGKLFFAGDGDLRFSTRVTGHFVLATGVLMAIGVPQSRRLLTFEMWTVLLTGLAIATLPAALVSNSEIKRWLTFVPFAILAATCGIEWMVADRRRFVRAGGVVLLAAGVAESVNFFAVYFGAYRADSAPKFGGNLRGAIQEVHARAAPGDCVMLDMQIMYVGEQWALYRRGYDRMDLPKRPIVVGSDPSAQSSGACAEAIALALADDGRFAGWQATPIRELNGSALYAIYRHHAP
jgi:4-amino-4-deoxy-L-arabinose transferase-like glycosyltransferase